MSKPRVYQSEVCPYCGSEVVDYDDSIQVSDSIMWYFTCNKCGRTGVEVYSITYKYTDGEEDA